MPRFFIRREQIEGETLRLLGEDAHHVARSLRMAVGEEITVCDMQGIEYTCEIVSFSDDREVCARICSTKQAENELPFRVTLYQALPKGDKLDTVIQKAVECGACEIVPFESERCVVRVKADAEARKTERRARIAEEAAKQSGRSVLPTVRPTVSFEEMLTLARKSDLCLFCYEGDGTLPLGELLREWRSALRGEKGDCSVSVIIGSEGGFSQREVQAARQQGMLAIGLGKRILRTETAPIFALSCLVYVSELDG